MTTTEKLSRTQLDAVLNSLVNDHNIDLIEYVDISRILKAANGHGLDRQIQEIMKEFDFRKVSAIIKVASDNDVSASTLYLQADTLLNRLADEYHRAKVLTAQIDLEQKQGSFTARIRDGKLMLKYFQYSQVRYDCTIDAPEKDDLPPGTYFAYTDYPYAFGYDRKAY